MRLRVIVRARVPLTMQISRGLVGPNRIPNRSCGNGKPVNIPVLSRYTVTKGWPPTHPDRCARAVARVKCGTSVEYHNDEKRMNCMTSLRKGVALMPGAREKGAGRDPGEPYPAPAQVPLGEKPQM